MAGGKGGSYFDAEGGAGGTIDPVTGLPNPGGDAGGAGAGGGGGSAGGGRGGAGTTRTDPETGQTTTSGAGGNGGADGIGPVALATGSSGADASGGLGGDGRDASGTSDFAKDNAAGGGGGEGGYGLILTDGVAQELGKRQFTELSSDQATPFVNSGNLSGGRGGAGGSGLNGGDGGDGGITLDILAADVSLSNSGTLTGGSGGAGGGSDYADLKGAAGAGGAGVRGGESLNLVNAGSITGGLSGDGITRADAITFTGGDNRLTLGASVDDAQYQQGTILGDIGVTGTLDIASGNDFTPPTVLSNALHGSGSVTVTDGNRIRLTGASTYTGSTEVVGGGLVVDGSITSDVTVNGYGYLSGSGLITGDVTIRDGYLTAASNAAVDPVNNISPSTLQIVGDLTLSAGTQLFEDILSSSSFDTIDVTGKVDLGGATFKPYPQDGAVSATGDVFTIIENDGEDLVIGTFGNAVEGQTIDYQGRTYQISYVGNVDGGKVGNDVTLTDITGGGGSGGGSGGGGSGGGGTTPRPAPVTPTPALVVPTPVPVTPVPVSPTPTPAQVTEQLTNNTAVPVPADTVSIAPNVSYADGAFTLTGSASSPAGVTGVEISALLDDGARQDLGAAAVNGDGTWTFTDPAGAAMQSFFTATVTDEAGGSAVSADAGFSLQAGLAGRTVARQDSYSADGSAIVASSLFRADGSRTVQVNAGGQTFQSGFFDTFRNGEAPDNTFVFDPGHGLDVVSGFRVDGTDHDTLSLLGSDFGGSVAEVLRNTHNVGGSAVITDPTSGDTIKLAGISKAELKAHQGDFAFHA